MEASKLTACACLGTMYGEPHCYCKMMDLKLPLNEEARARENARAEAQLKALFAPGGLFDSNRNVNKTGESNVEKP